MEMKYVVPDMAQSFGTLEFAGESEPVFERDKNNRRVLARRSYNLYSDAQRGENVVVEIPVQAGEKKFKYEQKVKLVNPKLYGRGYAIGDMGHTDYVCIKMSYKKHEKVSALFRRELKRYFSTPVYLLNTMLGIVSLVLLTIYSCLKIDTVTIYLKLIGMSFKVENTSILLAFVIGLLIILSNVTYASISIEGKQRELLKSYPISIRELLLAKYLFHLSLTVPMIFICATLLGIVCRMNVSEYCLLFLLPTVFSVFVGALGLLINLVFPNYEWENVTYIVKQSISAIITILLSVLIVGGSLWIVLYFFHTHILFASYILAVLFVLLTMLIGILLKKASKTF